MERVAVHRRGNASLRTRGKAWTSGCLLTVGISLAAPAGAATISYDAIVDSSGGLLGDAFPEGAAVEVTYTLDPDVEDQNSDARQGEFPGAVSSLSISLPEIGVSVMGTAGEALIFDNNIFELGGTLYDRAIFRGRSVVSTGLPTDEPIVLLEADFSSGDVFPPIEPMMLDSDALAAFELPLTHASIGLLTTTAQSYMRLVAAPSNSILRLKYRAIIGHAVGPLAEAFPDGAAVDISYALDRHAVDGDVDPVRGEFRGAVQSLSVSLPETGASILTGPVGYVLVFDNALHESSGTSSDQVSIVGGQITAADFPGGETLDELELEFFSDSVPLSEEPTMIESDALPTSKLPLTRADVYLRTAGQPTFFTVSEASSGSSDDGCAIGGDSLHAGAAWFLILPVLVLWHFRRR